MYVSSSLPGGGTGDEVYCRQLHLVSNGKYIFLGMGHSLLPRRHACWGGTPSPPHISSIVAIGYLIPRIINPSFYILVMPR